VRLVLPLTLPLVALTAGLTAGGCRSPKEPIVIGDPTGPAAPLPPSGPETRVEMTLPSGLRVVLEESHVAPVVALQLWAAVGSADDPPEMSGLAHVFEHTLFASTKRRAAGQIAREIDAAGGTFRAWTSFDQTAYQILLAAPYADTGLDILADVLTGATFDAAEVERARKLVAVELRQADESADRTASQALFRAAFSVHPYGRPVLGTDAGIAAVTREQLAAAYQRIYGGRNLTLVAVGDFSAPALKDKVAAAFASLRRGEAPGARRIEPAQAAPRTIVLGRDLPETQLWMAFHTPAVTHDDVPALDLLSAILGQRSARGGRLEQRLVRSRQLAIAASSYTFASRDGGLFVAGATMAPGRLEEPARALLDEVLRLAREDVSPDELDAARTQALAGVLRDQETPAGYARKLGFFASIGGDIAREEAYRARLAMLTPADLRAVAGRYLRAPAIASAALVSSRGVTGSRGAVDPIKLAARLDAVWTAGDARAERRFAAVPIARPGDEVVRVVLPSGLRVLVLRDPSAGFVDVQAMWPGGLRYEDARSNGISNLIAAMLTRGTKGRAGWQLAAELDAMPGTLAAFSTRNALGMRAALPGAQWERGLELLADCIVNPQFSEDELERQRRGVLEQIRAQERDAASAAFHLFASTLWTRHPYRMPELGSADTVASLSRRRLVDHYRRYYGIAGLTIAVVGNVAPARVVAKLQSLLGDGGAALETPPVPVEPSRAEPVEVFRAMPADDAQVVLGYPGTTLRDPDRFTLEVLAEILSGPSGRLASAFRDQRPFVRGSTARSFAGIDPGSLSIAFQCRAQNLDASVAAARAELARLVERGVTADEVGRARRYLVGAHAVALEPRSAIAAALVSGEIAGQGPRDFRRYGDAIGRITPADVQRVARKFMDPRHEVIAVVRPPDDDPAVARRRGDDKVDSRPSAAGALKTGAGRSSAP
jgi:zinc protease